MTPDPKPMTPAEKRKRRLRQPKHLRDSMQHLIATTYIDEYDTRSITLIDSELCTPRESRGLIKWLTRAAAWQAQQ
jgi:hypothetical protein